MRNYKLLLFFSLLIFFEFQSITYAQNTQGDVVYDYFLVVDVSGSMEGKPLGSGHAVIFPEVKRKIIDFLENNVRSDSNVVIIPFSRGVEEKQVFFKTPVKSQEDIAELKNRINSLQAKGQETWIYHALDTALKWSEKVGKQAGSSRKHIQTIYLYTDGLNNGPDSLTLDEILTKFRLRRAETEHLYLTWITIGGALQPEEVKAKTKDEPGVTLKEVGPKDPVPSPPGLVGVKPTTIDLQNIYLSKGKSVSRITLFPTQNTRGKTIVIKPDFPQGLAVSVSPQEMKTSDEPQDLHFELGPNTKEGKYEGKLRLSSLIAEEFNIDPKEIPVKFNYRKPVITLFLPSTFDMRIPRGGGEREQKIKVEFNETAKAENMTIQLELVDKGKGSNIKIPEHVCLRSNRVMQKSQKITVDKDTKEVSVYINIPKSERPQLNLEKFEGEIIPHSDPGIAVKIERNGKTSLIEASTAFAEEKGIKFTISEPPDIKKYIIAGGIGAVILCFLVFLLGRRAGWWQSFDNKVLTDSTGMETKLKKLQDNNLWFSPKLTFGSSKENIDIKASGLLATLTLNGGKCRIIPNPKSKGAVKIAGNDIEEPKNLPIGSSFEVGNRSFTLKTK